MEIILDPRRRSYGARCANTSQLYRYFNQRLLRLIMPYIIHTEQSGSGHSWPDEVWLDRLVRFVPAWIGRWARLMPAIIVVSVNRVYTNNGSDTTGRK